MIRTLNGHQTTVHLVMGGTLAQAMSEATGFIHAQEVEGRVCKITCEWDGGAEEGQQHLVYVFVMD